MKIWRICLCVLLLLAAGLAQARYDQVEYFHLIERDDVSGVRTVLLQGKFNANTFNAEGFTALYVALREPAPKVADLLIEQADTQLNLENAWGENALMMAAMRGLMPQAVRMMELGAEVNKKGWAPLHYAASAGQADMIRLLLANYAYIDALSPTGETPLMMAAARGTVESVQLLLEAEADTSLRNKKRQTAEAMALARGNTDNAALIRAWVARGGQPEASPAPRPAAAALTSNALPLGSGSAPSPTPAPTPTPIPTSSPTAPPSPTPVPSMDEAVQVQAVPEPGRADWAQAEAETTTETTTEPPMERQAEATSTEAVVEPATPISPIAAEGETQTTAQSSTAEIGAAEIGAAEMGAAPEQRPPAPQVRSVADAIAAPASRAWLQILAPQPDAP